MSISFADGIKQELNSEKTFTENGAVAYETSGKSLVDINFAVSELRGASVEDIKKRFSAAYFENPALALRWLFFARDVRQGMGERRLFRICLKWLDEIKPEVIKRLVPIVAEYGREDDLIELFDSSVSDVVFDYIKTKLEDDVDKMNNGKAVSLLAKWCPSSNTSSATTRKAAHQLIKKLGWSEKQYRKTLSALRKHLDVVEVKASSNEWSQIDYQKVPSKANLKYKDAFLKHDADRRQKFLDKVEAGEAKINSATNYPHDILHQYSNGYCNIKKADPAVEALWKALPDYVTDVDSGKTICVADGSGSMLTSISNSSCTALEVANALAIYFSEKLNGPFKDKYITFSSRPKLVDMSNAKSLHDKAEIALRHSECDSTNIEKVFDLLLNVAKKNNLKQEDIPNILILSDMNFDSGVYCSEDGTLMEQIAKKWKNSGYEIPRVTYWNICGGIDRHAPVPVQKAKNGVVLVSGFSPLIASMIYSQKTDPFDVLVEKLMTKRYNKIEELVKSYL